jgi:hypothetical protein
MNRFVTGIAVAATLLLAQGCSLSPKLKKSQQLLHFCSRTIRWMAIH